MNGIEKISARILADAETEAAAIRAQAEEKAAQIRTDYDRRIESEQQRLTAEAQAEAEKQLARDQGAARMAARRQLLETKQSPVDAAFRQAEQQLLDMRDQILGGQVSVADGLKNTQDQINALLDAQ